MAMGQGIEIIGISATDDAGQRDPARLHHVDDRPIAVFKPAITERQPAQPVVSVRIDTGIVIDQFRCETIESIRQHAAHSSQIFPIVRPIRQSDVEIGIGLAHGVVLFRMDRQREHVIVG